MTSTLSPLSSSSFSSFSDIFGPGGLLARSFSKYEFRPAQLDMAQVIAESMQANKCVLIEAGTGTGKTIAYLAPLICLGLRSVISTGTKNLQAQLMRKDIPLLENSLGKRIRAYSLKGRGNYICRRKWIHFSHKLGLSFTGTGGTVKSIKEWISRTKTGERSELEWLSEDDPLWSEIASTTEACVGKKCEYYEKCFITKARQAAASADLVIVNHHLLIADCCLRQRTHIGVIPGYSRLILDEAHMLEQIATEYLGLMVSNRRIQELTGDIRRELSAASIEDKKTFDMLEQLIKRSFAFFESIEIPEERFSIDDRIITRDVKDRLGRLVNSLDLLSSGLEEHITLCDSLFGCQRRTQEIKSTLEYISDHGDPDYVFWGERQGNSISLKVSPIDISKQLAIYLFKPLKGLVLTSATLSTNQGFDYIKSRLGLDPYKELILDSHFDYGKQALIFIPNDISEPAKEGFADQIGPYISRILRVTKGRALLLFTSYQNLNRVHDYLKKEDLGYTLLKQGESSREHLLEKFCTDISSVLLATSSFWQGVDVPGEALSCVIIDRLPFSVPTDPVTEARINWIRNRGGNPFQEYQLPSAIIALKQGLGRLIRHREDRGLLVILDPRIWTKSYGKVILKDLPKCPIVKTLDESIDGIRRLETSSCKTSDHI